MNEVYKKECIPFYVGLFSEDYSNQVTKISSPKDFVVKRISNTDANNFVYHHHYLHRKLYIGTNVSYGLYASDFCVGVCMYGYPVWREYPNLVPPHLPEECPELLRLSTMGKLPKNTESYFVGKTLKMFFSDWQKETGTYPKCVTSFCDIGIGFNGALYKATNFKLHNITKGRSANIGKAHGKWHTNAGTEQQLKHMYVYWYGNKSLEGTV